ncbi:MAG: GTP-binding protein, partial [Ilumatobacteraceae bacterium]
PPERIVIETSGVSDPIAVAQYAHLPGFRLDAVIVLADAETVRRRSTDKHVGRHVLQQLRGADLIALNKTDLLDPERLADVRAWLAQTAPAVRVVESQHAGLPMAVVFDREPVDDRQHPHHLHDAHDDHRTWTVVNDQPAERASFDDWLASLDERIVRAKGFVHFADEPTTTWEFQLVGARHRLTRRPPANDDTTRIVLIGLPGAADPEELS